MIFLITICLLLLFAHTKLEYVLQLGLLVVCAKYFKVFKKYF